MESNQLPEIRWYEGDCEHRAGWRSEAGVAPHADIRIADDRTGADDAYRLLEAGTALLWRGDWVNARHLMQALTKRADRRFGAVRGKAPKTPAEAFARHRQTQGQRAALLNRLLVPHHIKVSDWQGAQYRLDGATGKTALAENLSEIWLAVEGISGRPFDPLQA